MKPTTDLNRRSFLSLSSLAALAAVSSLAPAPPAPLRPAPRPELHGRWFAV